MVGAVTGLLLGLLLCWAALPVSVHAAAADGVIVTRFVKIIDSDDSGLPIGYPSHVAFDHLYEETYIYASNGRITIYDNNFFALGSIGVGRGVKNVAALAVGPGGTLYLGCLRYSAGKPQQSFILIYNSALLVEREIPLAEIPELIDFTVTGLAVAADGTMYLSGSHAFVHRGAAVLDSQGNFLRWMAPRGMVLREAAQAGGEAVSGSGSPEAAAGAEAAEAPPPGELVMVDGVTAVANVYIDETGRIYLLSAELSEIFVYDRQGAFLHKFGVKGGAKGKLSTPRALGVDYPRRLVYVVDYMRHTILTYDYDDGRFVYEFGGKGVAPLWYQHPNNLAVDTRGRVLVSDLFNQRVQVVDPDNPERPVLAPFLPPALGVQPPPPAAEAPAPVELVLPLQPVAPAPLAGMAIGPKVVVLPPRELVPATFKKKIMTIPAPAQQPGAEATLTLPGPLPVPGGLAAAALPAGAASGNPGQERSDALRTVLGVYGPVAAMMAVGVWFLHRPR
jgi:hypothetical protein